MFPRVWGLGSRHFQNLKFYKSILKLSQRGKNGHFSYFTCTSALESTIQADLILLSFSLLHFADTMGGGLFVYKLKVYGNPASN